MTIDLFIGRRFTGVSIEPDAKWPGSWRVRQRDRVSDIVNLTRAMDTAIAWACPRGMGGTDIAYWHNRETGAEAPPVRQMEGAYVDSPVTPCPP